MDPSTWNTVARVMAVLGGVMFGSAAISCACWVWLRKQVFAYGGSALTTAGVILLGLSIWHSVKFGVTAQGINFEAQTALLDEIKSLRDQITNLNDKTDAQQKILTRIEKMKEDLAIPLREVSYSVPEANGAYSSSTLEIHPWFENGTFTISNTPYTFDWSPNSPGNLSCYRFVSTPTTTAPKKNDDKKSDDKKN